jgi:signal transduction histidine kinase
MSGVRGAGRRRSVPLVDPNVAREDEGEREEAPRDPALALREAIASEQVESIRKALGRWATRVRAVGNDDDRAAFFEAAAPLAPHPRSKIREAVADALDVLPEAPFDDLLARFTKDEDHYVRAAAIRAAKRRATQQKARVQGEEQEKVVADLLASIGGTYGDDARRLAERAVRRGTESFVRMLHHEAMKIITPLEVSLARLRSDVTREDADPGALRRNTERAWERLSHLSTTIDRAREATATVTPRFCEEPLLPLIEEARAQLADRLGARAEKLAFVVDVDPALRLDVDRSALLQALQNFLQNAVEAYAGDAVRYDIHVAARSLRADSQVEITITDKGIGMSDSQRAHAYVPFGSRKPGGTGVGLLIARTRIGEVHGGTLDLVSAPGAGTTVKVVLPRRQAGRVARAKP